MKHFARMAALLLTVVMLLGLCACSSPEKKLIGTWESELDMTQVMNEAMGELMAEVGGTDMEIDATMSARLEYTFNEDKTYSVTVDADAMAESMTNYMTDIKGVLVEYLYQTFEAQGLSREDADTALQAQAGCTAAELIDLLLSQVDFTEMIDTEEMTQTGVYKVEDGKIFMAETEEDFDDGVYLTYTVDGSTMSLTGDEGDPLGFEDFGDSVYPMTLTKNK